MKRLGAWIMLWLACLGGCTSGRVVPPPYDAVDRAGVDFGGLEPGADLLIRLDDGSEYRGYLCEVTREEIQIALRNDYPRGDLMSIPRSRIEHVERHRLNVLKSAGAAIGTAAGIAALIVIGLFLFPPDFAVGS